MSVVDVSGFVLAGGKSSRMGEDKALLELDGRPLIAVAVDIVQAAVGEVSILSSREELRPYGRLVADVHMGCGPMGGMEAALLSSTTPWNLFLAVDMPFLPPEFLKDWVREVVAEPAVRVAAFVVGGRLQPMVCMVHRTVLPFVEDSIRRQEYKVVPMLEAAAEMLAVRAGAAAEQVLMRRCCAEEGWFANLNTPEEFAAASQLSTAQKTHAEELTHHKKR